jgi:hypothetical protein
MVIKKNSSQYAFKYFVNTLLNFYQISQKTSRKTGGFSGKNPFIIAANGHKQPKMIEQTPMNKNRR